MHFEGPAAKFAAVTSKERLNEPYHEILIIYNLINGKWLKKTCLKHLMMVKTGFIR